MSRDNLDIELPTTRLGNWLHYRNQTSGRNRTPRAWIPSLYSVFQRWYKQITETATGHTLPQVEDFRRGYPRFTALLGAHRPYFLCRRFAATRARLLLIAQDQVSQLEEQLELVDREESAELFLGNSRRDQNPRRKEVLENLDRALAAYDELVQRCHRMLSYESPQSRDVASLENWITRTACLARDETAYLSKTQDLLSVTSLLDDSIVVLEQYCENVVIAIFKWLRRRPRPRAIFSSDPYIYAVDSTTLRRITRAIMATTIVLALLVPVIIVNAIANEKNRMLVIISASALVVTGLAGVTKITTWEMFLAAATYATVLVIFVQNQTVTIS